MIDDTMLPTLKGHVFFLEGAAGVYFNGGSERSFMFGGKGLYPLVSRLIAAMDGRHSVAMIACALPPQLQPLFRTLLNELDQRSLLIDNRAAVADLPQAWHDLFPDTIAYFRDNVPDFAAAFSHWRRCSVTAVGSGYVMKALIRSLARSGVGSLTVMFEADEKPGREELLAAPNEHRERDPDFNMTVIDNIDAIDSRSDATRIVYAGDVLTPSDSGSALAALLSRDPPGLLVGGVIEGVGIVGAPPHSLTSRSVIGNLLALETMRLENKIARSGAHNHRSALRNWALSVSPGPEILLCPVFAVASPDRQATSGTVFASAVNVPTDREATALEQLDAKLVALFDPRTGLFSREVGGDIIQIPLALERIEVFWPRSYRRASHTVLGWGLNSSDAGMRAVLAAVACYASGVEAHVGVASAGVMTAAASENAWRERALLAAVAADTALFADILVERISSDRVSTMLSENPATDPGTAALLRDARTLYRLAQVAERSVEITMGRLGTVGSFLCAARAEDHSVVGHGMSAVDAFMAALGALAGIRQIGDAVAEAPCSLDWIDAASSTTTIDLFKTTDITVVEAWLNDRGYAVSERRFDADPIFETHGLSVGSIKLERR